MTSTRALLLGASMLAMTAAATPALAENGRSVAFGLGVGTLGAGASISTRLNDYLVLGVNGNYFALSKTVDYGGLSYSGDLELATAGLVADFHPFKSGFMISVGVYWNGNNADFDVTPTNNVVIGGTTYTPAQAGRLDGRVEFDNAAPFLGIGWDGALYGKSSFSFVARLGVLYQGEAKVTLTSSGTVSNADIATETAQIRSDIEDNLEFYPVLFFGVKIPF